MNLTAIRTAIETWLAAVQPLPVRWRERPQQYGQRQLSVHLSGFSGVRRDELLEDFDASRPRGSEYIAYQTGQRVATLALRADVPDQRTGLDAMEPIQMVRDSLFLPSVQATLQSAGAALGPVLLEPMDVSTIRDSRSESSAAMDLKINAYSEHADAPYGYIDRMEFRVTGLAPDGSVAVQADREIEVG